ncbi:1-phosphofructokinase, partial [hydrothermal vent metagenome]
GISNRALGFLGGYTGMEIEGILLQEGIYCDFITILQETRTNIVLDIESENKQIIFSAKGAAIEPVELTNLFKKLENLHSAEYVIFSGSLPPGLSPIIYERAVETANNLGATTILDTDGDNLKGGLNGKPNIIKPNIHELSRLVGKKLSGINEILESAEEIRKKGIEIVLVSMGADGILLVSEHKTLHAIPPDVNVVNTIGAGDSSVAGFVFGLKHNLSLKDCLKYAVAAGTASTLHPGTALANKAEIDSLFEKVKIHSA